jgi:hypothetical protein
MVRKKKAKKKEITADDTLRAFITVHVTETVGKIPASERAAIVDSIAELFGPSLVGTVKSAVLLMTEEPDTEEDEDEDEDEDYDDEDEDEEYDEDEDEE